MKSIVTILLISFFITILCFYLSLDNEFVYDDFVVLVHNQDAHCLSTSIISNILSSESWDNDIWGKNIRERDSHRSYRPLFIIFLRIIDCSIQYTKEVLRPYYFRLVSISLHVLVSTVVYYLTIVITNGHHDIAYATFFLFLSHPIHIEAVIAIANTSEVLSALFGCVAFTVYKNYCETGIFVAVIISASALVNIIQTKQKQNKMEKKAMILAIIICAFVFLFYLLFRMYLVNPNLRQGVHDIIDLKVLSSYTYISTFISNDIIRGYGSFFLEKSELIRKAENPFVFLSGMSKCLSLGYIHSYYLLLLLYPVNLCAEYAFDCIPAVEAISDLRNIATAVSYMSVVFLVWTGVKQALLPCTRININRNDDDESDIEEVQEQEEQEEQQYETIDDKLPSTLVIEASLWLLIPLIPASGIFTRIGTLVAERLLYLPSVGFCMLLSQSLYKVIWWIHYYINAFCNISFNYKASYRYFIIIIALIYSIQCSIRSRDWQNETTLYHSTHRVCPNSAKVNLQLSKVYLREDTLDLKKAKHHLDVATSIDPDFCDIGYYRAVLLLKQSYIWKAEEEALHNLKCKFTVSESWTLLASIWEHLLQSQSNNYATHLHIADASFNVGVYQQAVVSYLEASSYLKKDMMQRTNTSIYANIALKYYEESSNSIESRVWCNVKKQGGYLLRNFLLSSGSCEPLCDIPIGSNSGSSRSNSSTFMSLSNELLLDAASSRCIYIESGNLQTPALTTALDLLIQMGLLVTKENGMAVDMSVLGPKMKRDNKKTCKICLQTIRALVKYLEEPHHPKKDLNIPHINFLNQLILLLSTVE